MIATIDPVDFTGMAFNQTNAQNTATNVWEAPYIGSDTTVLYLPDGKAVYWRYGWKRQPGDMNGIVVTGTFPNSRYMSYNVYDEDTKMSLGSFTDFELVPDDKGTNPFDGTKKQKPNSTYTFFAVPEGSTFKASNVLTFPDSLTSVSIFLRHYLPAGDIYGEKPVPKIEWFDSKNMKRSAAPKSAPIPKVSKFEVQEYLIPLFKNLAVQFEEHPDLVIQKMHHMKSGEGLKIDELICKQVVANAFTYYKPGEVAYSYNFQTQGTYPNKDNYYLTMPIERQGDQVLLVKFQAAQAAENPSEYPDAQLRYYSISQGDDVTFNYQSLTDEDLEISRDGFIYVMIGDDSNELRAQAKKLDVNFMPWRVKNKMLLVYRHMVPNANFSNGINSVPAFDKSKAAAPQRGSRFIGDYAPTGKMFDRASVLKMKTVQDF